MSQKDIQFLENYMDWVNSRKLDPPTYSPAEYGEHLANMRNAEIVDRALEMLEFYNKGIDWPTNMLDELTKILRGEF
jgi:hypothetical protein